MVNLLLNLEGAIPALILLGLHFWLDWPLWPVWVALGLWVLGIVVWMRIVGWAADCGNTPDPPKENKNPYSVTNKEK